MSTSSQPVSRSASNSSEDSVVIENHMPFSRWFREIGWRHVVGVIALVFAAFPVLYVISASLNPPGHGGIHRVDPHQGESGQLPEPAIRGTGPIPALVPQHDHHLHSGGNRSGLPVPAGGLPPSPDFRLDSARAACSPCS